MRRCFATTIVLCVSVIAPFHPFSVAQEQSSSTRKIMKRVIPIYPDLARRSQLRGTVKIEAIVAPNGKVKLTQVVGGSPALVRAATDAIDKWQWVPATSETKEFIELNFHPD